MKRSRIDLKTRKDNPMKIKYQMPTEAAPSTAVTLGATATHPTWGELLEVRDLPTGAIIWIATSWILP